MNFVNNSLFQWIANNMSFFDFLDNVNWQKRRLESQEPRQAQELIDPTAPSGPSRWLSPSTSSGSSFHAPSMLDVKGGHRFVGRPRWVGLLPGRADDDRQHVAWVILGNRIKTTVHSLKLKVINLTCGSNWVM